MIISVFIRAENDVEKGEILVTSLFFFFHSVLQRLLILSQTSPGFLTVCITSLLKTPWEKEKLLITNNFPFPHSVFYPFGELSAIKFQIVVCKLFQSGRV